MQFAPLRFTKIDGTTVAVDVKSAAEAKEALKELRHKKRELKFMRGTLAKQQRAMKPKRKKAQPKKTGLGLFLDDMRWGLGAIIDGKKEPPKCAPTLQDVERELRDIDEVLHNIDGCILQIQGKLLTLG